MQIASMLDEHGRWNNATFSPTAEDLARLPGEILGAGRQLLREVGIIFLQNKDLTRALNQLSVGLKRKGFFGHELMQVTVLSRDGEFLYHDHFTNTPGTSTVGRLVTIYDVPAYSKLLQSILDFERGSCYWEDFASNSTQVKPEERFNVAFFGTNKTHQIVVFV
jgi:hypothetical protein